MEIDNPEIEVTALREKVTAAQQEFEMAVMFHEVWRPAAYDKNLHSRMGESFASQAFNVARIALRREMLLALVRLWDKNDKYKPNLRLQSVAATLKNKEVIAALVIDRVKGLGLPEAVGLMQKELEKQKKEVLKLFNKFMDGGTHYAVLNELKDLRNERLAHRQLAPATATGASATDEKIEEFYQDNSTLVRMLLSLVNAKADDPDDTARAYRHYATYFWAGVSGERTEGHPNHLPS